ncbi:MAG: ATP-binding protein [Symploca sp. SIO2E9]|nr:ATP-binding protein [Symploca sp. SIO2E9]
MSVLTKWTTNPGGEIPPDKVMGRDKLIKRLWRILERQSLVLTAERRMGKTCIVKKMKAEAPEGKLPVYRDLEGVRSRLEFVETVFQDVERYLSGFKRIAEQTRKLAMQLGGTEIAGVIKLPDSAAPHWKTLLTKTIEDLVKHQESTIIFFWDEMPLMLYNIKNREGEEAAMEILDTLRSQRQMHPDLRMVFTGSIGLHNVLSSLKKSGYANAPTNDMHIEDVPPLSIADAKKLALYLLEGEGIRTNNREATARAIAESVDCIPYFIHHIVDQLFHYGGIVDAAVVKDIVNSYLRDPQDPWHLRHYRERIDTYYAKDERPLALNLLDVLAFTNQPLPFDKLFNLLQSRLDNAEREKARDMLTLLQCDHYIIQQNDSAFRFRFPLIQRYWRLHRS